MRLLLLSALSALALAGLDNGINIFQANLGNPKKISGNLTSRDTYPSLESLFRRATTCAAGYGLCTSGYCCRLTEGCCPGGCAPSGASCCGATKYCDAGELCCLQGTPGCCGVGETCCGDKCMPSNAKCCNNSGDYCTAGNICVFFEGYVNPYCCTDLKCTAYVSGGRTIARTTTATAVATTTRNTQTVTTAAATLVGNGATYRYFYYTITWSYVYYYWYYSIAIQASVVTTSYKTATTTVSVYATATAQADRSLDSITEDFTTPYSATTLRPYVGSTTSATQATATGTTTTTTSRSSTVTAAVAGGLSAGANSVHVSGSWRERITAVIAGAIMWYL